MEWQQTNMIGSDAGAALAPCQGPGAQPRKAAQQRGAAVEVLGGGLPGLLRQPVEHGGDDPAVLGVGVLDVGGEQRDPVEQVVHPHPYVGDGRGERW